MVNKNNLKILVTGLTTMFVGASMTTIAGCESKRDSNHTEKHKEKIDAQVITKAKLIIPTALKPYHKKTNPFAYDFDKVGAVKFDSLEGKKIFIKWFFPTVPVTKVKFVNYEDPKFRKHALQKIDARYGFTYSDQTKEIISYYSAIFWIKDISK